MGGQARGLEITACQGGVLQTAALSVAGQTGASTPVWRGGGQLRGPPDQSLQSLQTGWRDQLVQEAIKQWVAAAGSWRHTHRDFP